MPQIAVRTEMVEKDKMHLQKDLAAFFQAPCQTLFVTQFSGKLHFAAEEFAICEGIFANRE